MTTTISVGDPVSSAEALRAMPIGTMFGVLNGGETYVKYSKDLVNNETGDRINISGMRLTRSGYVVLEVPAKPQVESLIQFMHRFRETALFGMEYHGSNEQVVREALVELGCGDDAFPVGEGMRVKSRRSRDLLPRHSLIRIGSPQTWANYGLFALGRNWMHLMGCRSSFDGRFTVVERVGSTEGVRQGWIDTPGDDSSAAQIAAFKVRAYQVGARVKRQMGWCSTYDQVVAQVGVDATCQHALTRDGWTVGQVVEANRSAALPLGTVLRWLPRIPQPDREVWYMRTEKSRNPAGTRMVVDTHPTPSPGHYGSRMEILGFGTEMAIPVDLQRMWPHLPTGTVFSYGEGSDLYTICGDRRGIQGSHPSVPAEGLHRMDAFAHLQNTFVMYLPSPA